MQIGSAKLGDVVGIFVDAAGRASLSATGTILFGTVYSQHNGKIHVGWRSSEVRPVSASPRSGKPCPSSPTLLKNHADFTHSIAFAPTVEIMDPTKPYTLWSPHIAAAAKPLAAAAVAPATPSVPERPLDYRFFQNKTPGECPCGGTRGVCPYHP